MTAYPTAVSEYLDSDYRGKGHFFMLFNPNGDSVTANGDNPLAVNKKDLRDTVLQDTGVKLPTIDEFRTGPMPTDLTNTTIDWAAMRTAATGLAVWVHRPDFEPSIYLVQNDHSKKINPDRWNFPSQLVGTNIPEQAFSAANSEMGLLIPTKDGSKLIGLNFELPDTLPQVSDDFKQSILAKRAKQEVNLRKELAKRFPEFADTPIEWQIVQTQALPETANVRSVTVSMLGEEFVTRAHAYNDDTFNKEGFRANSFNVHFPVSVDLSALPNAADLDFTKVMAIDPEQYGRNHGLHTAQDAKGLNTIPAPTDYFLTLEA
jgi:hypothetical protein